MVTVFVRKPHSATRYQLNDEGQTKHLQYYHPQCSYLSGNNYPRQCAISPPQPVVSRAGVILCENYILKNFLYAKPAGGGQYSAVSVPGCVPYREICAVCEVNSTGRKESNIDDYLYECSISSKLAHMPCSQ